MSSQRLRLSEQPSKQRLEVITLRQHVTRLKFSRDSDAAQVLQIQEQMHQLYTENCTLWNHYTELLNRAQEILLQNGLLLEEIDQLNCKQTLRRFDPHVNLSVCRDD